MPGYIKCFLFGAVFTLGLSVGTYVALEQKKSELTQNEIKEVTPVQDVVIRNVQEEKKNPVQIIETVVEETKLSPYAKMVIEKKYTKCGHTSVDTIDIPSELINMTEQEIMEKYPNWEIRLFSSKELYLFREITANCNDHFVLKEKDGFLAVYNVVTDDVENLKELTDIDVTCLPSGELAMLEEGINVYGQEELAGMIENYSM